MTVCNAPHLYSPLWLRATGATPLGIKYLGVLIRLFLSVTMLRSRFRKQNFYITQFFPPNAAYSLVFNGWYMYNKNIKSHNKLLHSLQPLTTVDTCYPQAQAAVAGTSPTPGGSSRLHLNCCWMTCVVDVLKKNHYQVWFADDTTLLTVTWMANKRYGLCPAVCFFNGFCYASILACK